MKNQLDLARRREKIFALRRRAADDNLLQHAAQIVAIAEQKQQLMSVSRDLLEFTGRLDGPCFGARLELGARVIAILNGHPKRLQQAEEEMVKARKTCASAAENLSTASENTRRLARKHETYRAALVSPHRGMHEMIEHSQPGISL